MTRAARQLAGPPMARIRQRGQGAGSGGVRWSAGSNAFGLGLPGLTLRALAEDGEQDVREEQRGESRRATRESAAEVRRVSLGVSERPRPDLLRTVVTRRGKWSGRHPNDDDDDGGGGGGDSWSGRHPVTVITVVTFNGCNGCNGWSGVAAPPWVRTMSFRNPPRGTIRRRWLRSVGCGCAGPAAGRGR